MDKFDVVGKSHPQLAAREKAVGDTKFVTDLVLPRMLHGRVLRSPHAHAKILSIDTRKAESLPGVKASTDIRQTQTLMHTNPLAGT